jgi:hypothetical protein
MKSFMLAAVALAACTDPASLDLSSTQAEAVARCDLPTRDSIAELLGDCVATSFGWQCTPCAVGSCAAQVGALAAAHEHVWTASACVRSDGAAGGILADLYLGQLICARADEPVARCLR